jgi:16S rRNA (cytidine1402-2'-O)-methyltransferase
MKIEEQPKIRFRSRDGVCLDSLGAVYLIPNLLGETAIDSSLPPLIASTVAKLSHFLVEDEKNARRFIKQLCPEVAIRELTIKRLNEHTQKDELESLASPLRTGIDIGIISEAGCPAIADPGSDIVRIAHTIGAPVRPLVGPCSMILALMGSGFSGQRWRFSGYLPIDEQQRRAAITSLERDLLGACRPETGLCIASALTTAEESIRSRSVQEWRAIREPLPRVPTIFVLGR